MTDNHSPTKLRAEMCARIAALGQVDVVILGGGVNGVAALRDLALNGVSAALIDTGDFCAGASSASSRMIHGGLRYLEGREFRLVAEATQERNMLLEQAPHLTKTLELVVPVPRLLGGFGRAIGRFAGLWQDSGPLSLAALEGALRLYEFLGRGSRFVPKHHVALSRADFPQGMPEKISAVVTYYDGQFLHPEALVLEMLEEALAQGEQVAALNHADWAFDGGGFTITDRFGGAVGRVVPKLVINASGAWIDRANAALGLKTAYLRGVKGAHLVLDNAALRARMDGRAFFFDDGSGRMVIALCVQDNVLIGTTEVEVADPDDKRVDGDEEAYLLRAIDGLFSDISVTEEDIVSMTTGIRPLRMAGGSVTAAPRDHKLEEDAVGDVPVLSMVGGKWTTFRAFAEQASDRALAYLARARAVSTRDRPYPGIAVPELSGDPARAAVLIRRYGARAGEVAAFCEAVADRALAGAPDYTAGEIAWIIHARGAATVEDIALRRTHLTLGHGLDLATLDDLAAILGAESGRDAAAIAAEVAAAKRDKRFFGPRAEHLEGATS
nr:FAD-dependent oxidoreductase [Aquicoccus sp. G2-2]MEA1113632.1 FAD-dependent oxidoreductase [Aquicoccus sp. G2-2]